MKVFDVFVFSFYIFVFVMEKHAFYNRKLGRIFFRLYLKFISNYFWEKRVFFGVKIFLT